MVFIIVGAILVTAMVLITGLVIPALLKAAEDAADFCCPFCDNEDYMDEEHG
jgi:hypothetical protein